MTYLEMQAWFEQDFLSIDLLEAVQFQRLDKTGTVTHLANVPFALRRAMTNQLEVQERLISSSEFLLSAAKTTFWHVLVRYLAPLEPYKGDLLIDQFAVRWVIWKVETQTAMTRYRLTCIRE